MAEFLAGGAIVAWILLALLLITAPLFIAHALYKLARAQELMVKAYAAEHQIQMPKTTTSTPIGTAIGAIILLAVAAFGASYLI